MHIEAMMMAEGLGQDADGVITAIRIGQNIFTPPSLPNQTKRAFLTLLVEDEGDDLAGTAYELACAFKDAQGEVIFAQTIPFEVTDKKYPDLRAASWFPVELVLPIASVGTHTFHVVLKQAGSRLGEKELNLHVLMANQVK